VIAWQEVRDKDGDIYIARLGAVWDAPGGTGRLTSAVPESATIRDPRTGETLTAFCYMTKGNFYATAPALATGPNNVLALAWQADTTSEARAKTCPSTQVFVSVFDGSWVNTIAKPQVTSALRTAETPSVVYVQGRLHVAWAEEDPDDTPGRVRIRIYDRGAWQSVPSLPDLEGGSEPAIAARAGRVCLATRVSMHILVRCIEE